MAARRGPGMRKVAMRVVTTLKMAASAERGSESCKQRH